MPITSPPTSNRAVLERDQQINELTTIILPSLTLSPQGLQTLPAALEPAVHTEDSGVMSEDEQPDNASGSRSHGSPNMQLVQMINDSFDSGKTDEDDKNNKDERLDSSFLLI